MAEPASPPSDRELFRWALWRLWKTPGQRWLLSALLVLLGTAAVCGYQTYQDRKAVIERLEARAAANRALQQTAFTDEEGAPDAAEDEDGVPESAFEAAERILRRPLTEEERSGARVQRLIARMPTSVAYSGGNFLATRSPSPLTILSTGVSDLWPDRFAVTAHSRRENLQREEIASPYRLEAGRWDPTAVVVLILPLFILASTYDCLSSDREAGVLGLILSGPIDGRRWTAIDLLVRTGVVLAAVAPVAAVPAVVEAGSGFESGRFGEILLGSGLWLLFAVAYGHFWGAAALFVHGFGGSSRQNGVMLTLLWVAVVSLVPSAAARLAELRRDVSGGQALITAERGFRQTAEANGDELRDAYYAAHPEVARPTRKEDPYGQTRWDAIRLEVDRRMGPRLRGALDDLHDRFRTYRWGIVLSPALACTLAQDDLCGTSLPHHVGFVRAAGEYDEEFKTFFQPRMMSRANLTLADHEAVPAFRRPDRGPDGGLLAASLASIAGWTVLLFGVGYRRLRLRFVDG